MTYEVPNPTAAVQSIMDAVATEIHVKYADKLTPNQFKRLKEITLGHVRNNHGHRPNVEGLVQHVKSIVRD